MTTENQKGTLAADLTALLASGVGADTTLVVGDTCLPAHRAVLMARSPFFRSTFAAGSPGAHSSRVVLDDMEPEVAKQLLAFMYGDEAPQLGGTAAQLLQAADRYGLPVLKARCGRHLAQQLSVENAAATAVFSLRHGCGDLTDAAVTFIRENALQVMFTEGWAQALHRHPQTMAKISLRAGTGSSRQRKSVSEEKAEELGWELYEAAAAGNVGRMQKLFADGASLETGDEDSDSPLFMAASEGHVGAVRWLLQAGAEVDKRNYMEQTPMHKAAERGHASVVRLLVAASAIVNAADESGDTPLHLSAMYGHAEAARALLEAGADRSLANKAQQTPWHVATQRNWRELLDILK